MKYLVVLLILILTACGASEPPPYVVTVENRYGGLCSGSAIDATHVLTAGHCINYRLDSVQTSDHTVAARPVAVWREIDTALYETAEPMNLAAYATPGDFDPLATGYLFGSCGVWDSPSGRLVNYAGIWSEIAYCGHWQVAMSVSCSGDSGGPVEQKGVVVGMMVSLSDWQIADDVKMGNQLCIVPTAAIQERLVMWRNN